MTGALMNPGKTEPDSRGEVRNMGEKYYFAYGSNMNLDQMEHRCPDAEVVGRAVLKDYRLVFRGNRNGNGVASVVPDPGKEVRGLLWKITPRCERSLDFYEGYPRLYGKEEIKVQTKTGEVANVAVYIMNEPYQSQPALPSDYYLKGILDGCRQNHLTQKEVRRAVEETKKELGEQKPEKMRPRQRAARDDSSR